MDQILLNLSYGLGLQGTIGWFLPVFIGTVNVLPALLVLFNYADKSAQFNTVKSLIKDDKQLYDFIVVGGGSAGALVANRLSETYSVLLLERGGEAHPLTSVPALESLLLNKMETDYAYRTLSQNNSCLSLNNQESIWSRGKGLGGSSSLNSMVYLRGHPYDYDIWAHWTRDNRWNYEALIPFFLKHEQYCFMCEINVNKHRNSTTNPNFHGTEGELHLSKPTMGNLVDEFLDGMEWAGAPHTDLNAPFSKGSDSVVYTQKFGRRMSSRDAFLNPIRDRKNLKIVKYAQVYKVLFDGTQAYGVEYEQFGKIVHAGVTKEIILSAGAIDTPKILMLSGVGPKQHLNQIGVPVVYDSPFVGQNLQDHVGTLLGPFLINQPISYLPKRNLNLGSVEEFLQNGAGPFTLSITQAVSVFASSKSEFTDYPDIQISLSATGLTKNTAKTLSQMYNIKEELLDQFYGPLFKKDEKRDAFNLMVNYGRPRSRGELKLKSANYRDDLIINPNYYSVKQDIQVVVEGLKKAVEIIENAPSFKNLKTKLSPVPWPKCEMFLFRSDEYFECLAREISLTLSHFVGTVRMGGAIEDSAVDSELNVRGVKNLRVIDASVMPFITSMDVQAAVLVLAERGAQFVNDHWKVLMRMGKVSSTLQVS